MSYELWDMVSKNLVFYWNTANEADAYIRKGIGDQGVDALADHALVSVDEHDETTLLAEGPAILDTLAVLKLIDEIHLTDVAAGESLGRLLVPIVEQYQKLYGSLNPVKEGWLQGFLAARLLSGSFEVTGTSLRIVDVPELHTNQLPELAKAG